MATFTLKVPMILQTGSVVTPPRTNTENDNSMLGFAIVPYIQGITEPIKRILGSFNVKVAQKLFMTLGHTFAKRKYRIAKEQRTDAIFIPFHTVVVVRSISARPNVSLERV